MGVDGCGWVWTLSHHVVKCAQYVHMEIGLCAMCRCSICDMFMCQCVEVSVIFVCFVYIHSSLCEYNT